MSPSVRRTLAAMLWEEGLAPADADEVLWEMQRCNAFAVEFHRWRDDWLARRATMDRSDV